MDLDEELRNGLSEFMKNQECTIVFACKVTTVNEDEKTCDAIDVDKNEILDIRFRADDSDEGICICPKIGSWILIGNINAKEEYFIISYTQIEKILFSSEEMSFELDKDKVLIKKQDTKFEIDQNGFDVSANGQNLKSLIGELLGAIMGLTVTCTSPGSPSSPPINLAQFQTLQTKFNSLLK